MQSFLRGRSFRVWPLLALVTACAETSGGGAPQPPLVHPQSNVPMGAAGSGGTGSSLNGTAGSNSPVGTGGNSGTAAPTMTARAGMGGGAAPCTQMPDGQGCMPATDPKPNQPVRNADGTLCYTFLNHGEPVPGDTTPYGVIPGEHYVAFFYTAPWTEPSELVRWRTIYDKPQILHHWLLYSTVGNAMDGTFIPSIGTHFGDAAQLIAGWAVGGNDVQMPAGVGLQVPGPGEGLMIEWHFYNNDLAPVTDRSGIEVCVVPAGSLEHTAGMTWLGTENFNGPVGMPPGRHDFGGTCIPGRYGMTGNEPIRIFSFWPHMHTHGRHMKSIVHRADGRDEEVFNKPFDFNHQITYPAMVDLHPGDTITSTCTFENTSGGNVAFGPSTGQEMCYQFAFSYPAGALENGTLSLVGATNTCW